MQTTMNILAPISIKSKNLRRSRILLYSKGRTYSGSQLFCEVKPRLWRQQTINLWSESENLKRLQRRGIALSKVYAKTISTSTVRRIYSR